MALRCAGVVVGLLVGLVLGLAAAGPSAAAESALDRVRQRGELHIGVALFQPWAMRDAEGRLIGFEIDVAKRLAADLGVEPVHRVIPFPELIPALREGAIDIVISGLSITPQRALEVAFSVPYSESGAMLVAGTRASGLFDRVQDFNDPEVIIAAVADTTALGVAAAAFPEARVVAVNNQDELRSALISGRVTAAVASSPWPELETLRYPDRLFLPLKEPLVTTGEAFAVQRDDFAFVNYLNAWIAFRTLDRWLSRRYQHWFRSLRWEQQLAPGDRRVQPLSTGAQ